MKKLTEIVKSLQRYGHEPSRLGRKKEFEFEEPEEEDEEEVPEEVKHAFEQLMNSEYYIASTEL